MKTGTNRVQPPAGQHFGRAACFFQWSGYRRGTFVQAAHSRVLTVDENSRILAFRLVLWTDRRLHANRYAIFIQTFE